MWSPFLWFCSCSSCLQSLFVFKDFIYLFIDRGEGWEKERERNIIVWLPLRHLLLGTWPAIQACALTGNQTSNPLILRPALHPLSYTSQCCSCFCFLCSVVDSCELVVILLFIVLIFFLDKSLEHFIQSGLGDDELLELDLTWEALYLPFHSKW